MKASTSQPAGPETKNSDDLVKTLQEKFVTADQFHDLFEKFQETLLLLAEVAKQHDKLAIEVRSASISPQRYSTSTSSVESNEFNITAKIGAEKLTINVIDASEEARETTFEKKIFLERFLENAFNLKPDSFEIIDGKTIINLSNLRNYNENNKEGFKQNLETFLRDNNVTILPNTPVLASSLRPLSPPLTTLEPPRSKTPDLENKSRIAPATFARSGSFTSRIEKSLPDQSLA